jgi:hypothetical protein
MTQEEKLLKEIQKGFGAYGITGIRFGKQTIKIPKKYVRSKKSGKKAGNENRN